MPTAENLREKIEAQKRENARLQKEIERLKFDKSQKVDWTNPTRVVRWYGRRIQLLLSDMANEKPGTRLRALNEAIKAWSSASRLAHDSSEIEALKADLEELKEAIAAQRKTGPTGVVTK